MGQRPTQFGFAEPTVRHQKSGTHKKRMDFEYKMIIVMYHPKRFGL